MRRKRFSVDRILAVLRQAEMGGASGSADPSGGDHRRDSESLEEALEGLVGGPGAPIQATAGREWPAEEVGGRTDSGPGDVAGRAARKLVKPSCASRSSYVPVRQVPSQRAAGLHSGAAAASDAPVPEHSRSADRAADAHAGVGTGADSIRLSQAAGGADSGWLASGQEVGLSSVPRGDWRVSRRHGQWSRSKVARAAGGRAESGLGLDFRGRSTQRDGRRFRALTVMDV